MGRGLDGFLDTRCLPPRGRALDCCAVLRARRKAWSRHISVAIAWGKHLFPFRTEKLSPTAPMVLVPYGAGRVGRRRFF